MSFHLLEKESLIHNQEYILLEAVYPEQWDYIFWIYRHKTRSETKSRLTGLDKRQKTELKLIQYNRMKLKI